eukprot:TRINITY_DN4000_c0_g1_i1.p2 TRINITY_DN4000_c0_g1~~TRINITY_DN4000_c0_g1_i1.p2  ORF type:complete len:256 (+),score=61.87 TRINITY_DN4000_c0_g1_i1:965-1732(+)
MDNYDCICNSDCQTAYRNGICTRILNNRSEMLLTTFLARASDGLLLCENYFENNLAVTDSRRKILSLLKGGQIRDEAPEVKVLEINNVHHLCYKVVEGVIYLVLSDSKYPVKLANAYLDDVQSAFTEELKTAFGAMDYRNKIETIEKPYFFIKFERVLKRKKAEFQDTGSKTNIERLKNDLTNVHNIMSQNIDLLLDREKNLNTMLGKAASLKENSKNYKDKTREVAFNLWLKRYLTILVVILVLLVFVYLKFFL